MRHVFVPGLFVLALSCASTPPAAAPAASHRAPPAATARADAPPRAPAAPGPTWAVKPFVGPLRQVDVEVAGAGRTFLFDTGGGLTVISPEVAEALGCTPTGRLVGFRMTGERIAMPYCRDVALTVAGQALTVPTVGVMDLNALMPPDWPKVAGMLSLHTLAGHVVTVDLGHDRVVVDPAGAAPTPVRFVRQASGVSLTALVETKLAGTAHWFLVDSGCFVDGVMLAPHAANVLGFDVAAAVTEKGAAPLEQVAVDIAGLGAVSGPALVKDIIYDGVVCAPVLTQHAMTLDLRPAAFE